MFLSALLAVCSKHVMNSIHGIDQVCVEQAGQQGQLNPDRCAGKETHEPEIMTGQLKPH